jgi:CRP-like cAMP-binding protein
LLTGAPVNATIRAVDEVSLLVIEKVDFERLLAENPILASLFTRLIAQRLAETTARLADEDTKAFAGKLDTMSLAEVIQALAEGHRSGTLVVETPHDLDGRIGFAEGRICSIERGGAEGPEQLFRMLTWVAGQFWFDTSSVPQEDRIQQHVMNLLLEGMRRLDEMTFEDAAVGADDQASTSEAAPLWGGDTASDPTGDDAPVGEGAPADDDAPRA